MGWLTIIPSKDSGNGQIIITAEADDDLDRECWVTIEGNGTEDRTIHVEQEGLREIFEGSDTDFILKDGDTFNVLKPPGYMTADEEEYYTSDGERYLLIG